MKCGIVTVSIYIGINLTSNYYTALANPSIQGQKWINRVRRCIKNKLLAKAIVIRNSNCQRILDLAFAMHPGCYIDTGFCSIAKDNWQALQAVFDYGDFFSSKSIQQVGDAA